MPLFSGGSSGDFPGIMGDNQEYINQIVISAVMTRLAFNESGEAGSGVYVIELFPDLPAVSFLQAVIQGVIRH